MESDIKTKAPMTATGAFTCRDNRDISADGLIVKQAVKIVRNIMKYLRQMKKDFAERTSESRGCAYI